MQFLTYNILYIKYLKSFIQSDSKSMRVFKFLPTSDFNDPEEC